MPHEPVEHFRFSEIERDQLHEILGKTDEAQDFISSCESLIGASQIDEKYGLYDQLTPAQRRDFLLNLGKSSEELKKLVRPLTIKRGHHYTFDEVSEFDYITTRKIELAWKDRTKSIQELRPDFFIDLFAALNELAERCNVLVADKQVSTRRGEQSLHQVRQTSFDRNLVWDYRSAFKKWPSAYEHGDFCVAAELIYKIMGYNPARAAERMRKRIKELKTWAGS